MPEETFRIRIRRDGRILFRSQALGEERLRQLREMIEDSLGPVTQVQAGDEPPRPSTGIVEADKQERLRQGGE